MAQTCYTGTPQTQGIGACKDGMAACDEKGVLGPCVGQVLPSREVCGNGIDENCNGTADENVDLDGDGFTTCGGDCCDSVSDGCSTDPKLVNPGAIEVASNQADDDCDGTVDNSTVAACDASLASNSSDPLDFARSIDLCQMTTLAEKKWGLIEAKFLLADGTGLPNAAQRAIRTAFGGTKVQSGASFAVLSTGRAAAVGQTNPDFASFEPGSSFGSSSGFPSDWLKANSNMLPNAPGCPAAAGSSANDPIMLQLKIRVPTNAKAFQLSTNFLSSEYPEFVCSPFNDFFVVLLDSGYAGTPANPADKNLATFTTPSNKLVPVGVNLAFGSTGLFRVCENSATGCGSSGVAGTNSQCMGTAELIGTGMDATANACGMPNNRIGGGTGWLSTRGNVVGGEIITLRIALWDTSDGLFDSLALLDNFQWLLQSTTAGTGT